MFDRLFLGAQGGMKVSDQSRSGNLAARLVKHGANTFRRLIKFPVSQREQRGTIVYTIRAFRRNVFNSGRGRACASRDDCQKKDRQ